MLTNPSMSVVPHDPDDNVVANTDTIAAFDDGTDDAACDGALSVSASINRELFSFVPAFVAFEFPPK
jgi:hypothetical protein